MKVGGELGRRDCQLPPGDAHHAPSGSFEAPVAGSVVLEGVRCVVVVPAVELDYHAPDRPDAVDLRSVDEDVGLWLREAGTQEELLEALLELAAHDAEAAPGLLDDSFDDRDSRFPRVALNELGERQAVGEPELLGLPQPAYAHLPLLLDAKGQKLSKSLRSLPVVPAEPLPALRAAWSALGQDPAVLASGGSATALLARALAAFQVSRIPDRDQPLARD